MEVKWKGVYPAVTTKFNANHELDIDANIHNLKAQIAAGINGIIIGGSLGEASTITVEEKQQLLEAALGIGAADIPIILNIAERRTSDAIAMAQMAQKVGAHGLMLLPPMQYKADSRETTELFKTVATNTDLPIMLYNNPHDYKIAVTLPMLEELANIENIKAVKESSRDITNVTRFKTAFGDRFMVHCGVDTLALECLAAGADGWVAGLVNAFPRETVVIYKLVKAGRIQEAVEIYRWFMPLLELDIHPKLVQYIKLSEVATGLGTEHVRAPRLALEGKEREEVLNIINKGVASRPDMTPFANL